jgi:hypothetical protein
LRTISYAFLTCQAKRAVRCNTLCQLVLQTFGVRREAALLVQCAGSSAIEPEKRRQAAALQNYDSSSVFQ